MAICSLLTDRKTILGEQRPEEDETLNYKRRAQVETALNGETEKSKGHTTRKLMSENKR